MSMNFLWKGSMGKSRALLSLTTGLETTYNTLCFKATNLPQSKKMKDQAPRSLEDLNVRQPH